MHISVTEAKGQLTELVRRAESGNEVILTRHGQEVVRLVPIRVRPDRRSRKALLESVRAAAALSAATRQVAARVRNQDFLYGTSEVPT
ncbi:type II toxin-antitoxin system Phd/YefM family antitoxin [Amphibiibacter pelophylacis]|uniref:type II toxin-antitoxin system Phd/YefM family antitoxin n=1 Tax=Amphibiibacter pelophylacis TaxID=1799477 RepID=UPI003BFA6FC6